MKAQTTQFLFRIARPAVIGRGLGLLARGFRLNEGTHTGARGTKLGQQDGCCKACADADHRIDEKGAGNPRDRVCLPVNHGEVGDGNVGCGGEKSERSGSKRIIGANGLEYDSDLD